MSAPRPDRALAALLLGACAATPEVVVAPRRDLPAATRRAPRGESATAGAGPTVLPLDDARGEAEALARALVDALTRGDEDALRPLLAATVEGIDGEVSEGREQVVALIRPWLPHLGRYLAMPGRPTAPGVFSRDDCPPGACTGIFLRRGDWLVTLPNAGLLRPLGSARPFRGAPGVGGLGAPVTQPPRRFIARRVDGAMRVVAVNDELLR